MFGDVFLPRGPTGRGATAQFLHLARTQARADPGSVLWLTPHPVAAWWVRERLVETGAACGIGICTFEDLTRILREDHAPGSRLLPQPQRRLLLEEVTGELLTRIGGLEHFTAVAETGGFLERLAGLIDELTWAGIEPEAFTLRARSPRERDCARLYAAYRRRLDQLGCHDASSDANATAGWLQAASPAPPPLEGVRLVLVEGFSAFTPGQVRLFEELRTRGATLHISLLEEQDSDRAELFDRSRQTAQQLSTLAPQTTWESHDPLERPAGLRHLTRQLFRPLHRLEVSTDATGIACILGPGLQGELRLAARRIRTLLQEGVAPEAIEVVLREPATHGDQLEEAFLEYGIPGDVPTRIPLSRNPAVSLLFAALRLPEDDFCFSALTALLRHSYFRPTWPETATHGDIPRKAEALLRLLGEPRGKDAYRAAVARWAEQAQPGLEDESAEESRRQKTHQLARECQPFLERLLHAWDGAPIRATVAELAAWVGRLADEIGLSKVVAEREEDQQAWSALWEEIGTWQDRDREPLESRLFVRRLHTLAARRDLRAPTSHYGGVRVLSAEEAQYTEADYRFVLGLGERSFPRPQSDPSLLEDADRQGLQAAGLDLPVRPDPYAQEMLLFYRLVVGTRKHLTLGYPAVDERGQELLPGSFFQAVQACFAPGAIETERRRMLIEGYATDPPLSPTEYRIQVGSRWPRGADLLPPETRNNLHDVAKVVHARFEKTEFTPHDGAFRDPFLVEWVGRLFGPQRVFSPTALEDYIACPFRFFLHHVLHLEPLEEPTEEIEVTRRGMAFHRALARLHRRLKEGGVHHPGETVQGEVEQEMIRAVEEDISRAPGPASKVLWRLEGQRLLRAAARYPAQWGKFLAPWAERGVAPRPHLFEVDFGMPATPDQPALPPLVLRHGGVEVRLWGRIDRIDLAELEDGLGFWIIDYKTGRAGHYSGTDLVAFRKLQLTLYAVAVEGVFFEGRSARPLGLAYWLVNEAGPKVVLPGRNATAWLEETARWPGVREQLTEWVARLASEIRKGSFPLAPRSDQCMQTCPYGQVCRITQARSRGKVFDLPLPGETPA